MSKYVKPIYITRSAHGWGQGETAVESFIQCLRRGAYFRDFKIVKLPEGVTEFEVSGIDGTITWAGSREEATEIPFNAKFLDRLKDALTDQLYYASKLMNLLSDLDGGKHRWRADDLEEIMEQLYDFDITEMKEAG